MMVRFAMAVGLAGVAIPVSAAPGWGTNMLTIESVVPTDGAFRFIVSGNDNPAGCSYPEWLNVDFDNPGYEAISSAVITAFAQGKKLRAWQHACRPDGSVTINAVWIDK
ncbi:MAG: hypothetical protein KKH33_07015 [Alphaproteobacteria bacterium]|nr:hypothetical protein [Alphaproteobacteria bacterium]